MTYHPRRRVSRNAVGCQLRCSSSLTEKCNWVKELFLQIFTTFVGLKKPFMVYLIRLIWCSFKFFFFFSFLEFYKIVESISVSKQLRANPSLTQSTDNELRSILGKGRGRCGVDQIMTMIETALCFLKKKEVERKKENRNRITIYFRRKFALISKFSPFVSQVNCSNPKIVSLDHVAQIIIRSFPVRI